MAVIISCVNLKGGVGKTAIAVNFSAYCGLIGKRTLLVDLDPQTNATFSCINVDEWEDHAKQNGTVADLFNMRAHANAEGASRSVQSIIKKDVFDGVDLLPSHLDLFTIDLDLASAVARETILKRSLKPILEDYDLIVCDCPPNLAIPTQNALAVSSFFVVPVSVDYLSSIGVALLLKRVKIFSQELEHNLTLAGIVISRVGRPAVHREETVAALRETFKKSVLKTEIKERVAVSESVARQNTIYSSSDEAASEEFTAMSVELLERMGIVS